MSRSLALSFALLSVLAACRGTRTPPRHVTLTWPAAVLPPDAADLRYELSVWRVQDGVPTTRVVHHPSLTTTSYALTTPGLPAECCWSVRAHWRQNGQPRQSRWLAAGGRPVTTGRVPSLELARTW